MEIVIRAAAAAVIGSILALLLRKYTPELSLTVTILAGVIIVWLAAAVASRISDLLREIAREGWHRRGVSLPGAQMHRDRDDQRIWRHRSAGTHSRGALPPLRSFAERFAPYIYPCRSSARSSPLWSSCFDAARTGARHLPREGACRFRCSDPRDGRADRSSPGGSGAYSFRRFAGGTAAGERMANAPANGMEKSTLLVCRYLPHGRDTPLCVRACIAHGYARSRQPGPAVYHICRRRGDRYSDDLGSPLVPLAGNGDAPRHSRTIPTSFCRCSRPPPRRPERREAQRQSTPQRRYAWTCFCPLRGAFSSRACAGMPRCPLPTPL